MRKFNFYLSDVEGSLTTEEPQKRFDAFRKRYKKPGPVAGDRFFYSMDRNFVCSCYMQ